MSFKFLRQTGEFALINSGDVSTSTSTNTSALLSFVTNSIGSDTVISQAAFTDGPSVTQGSSGTWLAFGTVTTQSSNTNVTDLVKLWDGTTVIAASAVSAAAGGFTVSTALSGIITSPAGNIKMSVKGNNPSFMLFNITGTSKDCTVTAIRIG